MSPPQTDPEVQRILRENTRRTEAIPADFYALHHPANLFNYQGQQRALLNALIETNMFPLAERRILDVGCGTGAGIGMFELFGAQRSNIAGIELDPNRAAVARQRFPDAEIRQGSAPPLPWDDETFDIALQATVFTSILEPHMKQSVAAEMLRVLKPKGVVLWYDFRFNNPSNPNVRGIGRRELCSLFPGCRVRLRRVTLAPPIARKLVPFSWPLARTVEHLRLLSTHYMGVIRKSS
jgi:SAM-dependent methyltransferase